MAPLPCTAEIRLMRSLSSRVRSTLAPEAARVVPAGAAIWMRSVSVPSSRLSSSRLRARSALAAPAGMVILAGNGAVRSAAVARPRPATRLIGTSKAAAVEPVRLMRMAAPSPDSPATASSAWIATSGCAGGTGKLIDRSSIARPWSLPLSLVSIQRNQRVEPAAQGLAERSRLPPRPVTRPALLPSTDAAVADAMGEVQLKLPPGATHAVT